MAFPLPLSLQDMTIDSYPRVVHPVFRAVFTADPATILGVSSEALSGRARAVPDPPAHPQDCHPTDEKR